MLVGVGWLGVGWLGVGWLGVGGVGGIRPLGGFIGGSGGRPLFFLLSFTSSLCFCFFS